MDKVKEEKRTGKSRGVSSTPTIFIGERKLEGAHPYRAVRRVIENQLD